MRPKYASTLIRHKGTSAKVNAVTGSGVAIVEIMIVPFVTFLANYSGIETE